LLEDEPDLLTEDCRATLAMDDYPTVANLGAFPYIKGRVRSVMSGARARYGARISAGICTRGCHCFPHLLA
jgi:hypothetical protein